MLQERSAVRGSSYLARGVRLCAAAVAWSIVSGCSGIYLYHADDHKLAQTAQASFKAAELTRSLAPERDATEKLLARELAAVRRDQASMRDEKIVAFLSASSSATTWDMYEEELKSRLNAILGTGDFGPNSPARSLRTIRANIETFSRQTLQEQDVYFIASQKKEKPERPICDEKTLKQSPPFDPELALVIKPFLMSCETLLKARAELAKVARSGGLLRDAGDQLDMFAGEASELDAKVKVASAAYDNVLNLYRDEVAKGQKNSKLQDVATKLKTELDNLDKIFGDADKAVGLPVLKDLDLSAMIEKVKRQKEAVDEGLNALAEEKPSAGGGVSETTSLFLSVAATVSGLEKHIDLTRYPQASVLLLESEMLRLDIDAYQRRLARAKEMLDLLKQKRDALLEEPGFLLEALDRLGDAKEHCPRNSSLMDDYKKDRRSCRQLVASSLVDYSTAWMVGRMTAEELDYRMLGIRQEYVLDQSEIALGQTEALIGAPLERLVALYGSGLKSEDLSNLIQALGLGSIAVRVK